MVTIINYGTSNSASIKKMIQKVNPYISVKYSNGFEDIVKARKIILPGVGAFDTGMNALKKLGLVELLKEKALEEKVPFMGICLGMQLFLEQSEEGKEKGLGLIKGEVRKFEFENMDLSVPHMGWNFIKVVKENPLIDFDARDKFYFVHSYFVKCKQKSDVLAVAKYGFEFDAALQRENIFGFQFHPEKSHLFGENLIKKFLEL